MPNTDRERTQEFEIMNILVNHCGENLTPHNIDKIMDELKTAIQTGPCSWAFKDKTE